MNNLKKFECQRLSKKQLSELLINIADKSGCKAEEIEGDLYKPFSTYRVELDKSLSLVIHVYIANISGAGWADKPEIKRIQIRHLPPIPRQQKREFFMLCGICKYDSQMILTIWDPMKYQTHNTSCSCYVFVSSFEKAINSGIYSGINKGKEVITCTEFHFGNLLKELSSRYL